MQKYFWRETPAHHYPTSYRRKVTLLHSAPFVGEHAKE